MLLICLLLKPYIALQIKLGVVKLCIQNTVLLTVYTKLCVQNTILLTVCIKWCLQCIAIRYTKHIIILHKN